ncbi:hypothetical protein B7P43_G12039 [Cryptotermes secundus]|uniref:Uncharacterized protein n=1 Tax=Cryptotermes secundus TaxID=105785 RepID=A0A2J7Q8G5_9NEOP|nr:hypothetical protein B7P43_G12039 [Cryptotermes secundus]
MFPIQNGIKTDTLMVTSKEVGLEVNTEETRCVLLSHHHNAGQNHNTMTTNRSFQNVAEFKCLGMTLTNKNLIPQEIKRTLYSHNAYHYSFLLSLKS